MRILLAPVVILAMVWVPGVSLRLLLRSEDGASEHRLFEELLLGTAAVSWVALLLTEFHVFHLLHLLAALAGLSLVAALGRRHRPGRYGRADAAGVGVVLLAVVWSAPPFDTLLYGSDSSVYQAGGIHLAQTGQLEFIDPSTQMLSPRQQAWLLPSLSADGVSPPYWRLTGGFTLAERTSPAVLPAFHHLFMVWTAICVAVGGLAAAPWAVTLFAALALWAVYRLAADLDGSAAGVVCVLLLMSLAPQHWYSRFPMPEVPAQFFLWAALGSFVAWQRSASVRHAALAGVGLGICGLMRAEQLPLLALPLACSLLFFRRTVPLKQWAVLLATAGGLWLHAAVHLATYRTHYFGFFKDFAAEQWRATGTHAPVVVLVLALPLVGYWLARRKRVQTARAISVASAAGAMLLGSWLLLRNGMSEIGPNVTYLTYYLGLPLLLASLVGAYLLRDKPALGLFSLTLLVATVHVIGDPHAQPVPLWVARRFVPMVLPGCAVLAAVALTALRTSRRVLGAVAVGVCTLTPLQRLLPLAAHSLYPPAAGHVQAVAALLPSDAVLLVNYTGLVPTHMQAALWAIAGTPSYVLDPGRTRDMAGLVQSLSPRPVYCLTAQQAPAPPMEGLSASPVGSYEFWFPAADFERYRQRVAIRQETRINVYRLDRSRKKRGSGGLAAAPPS